MKDTQCAVILAHLKQHGSITPLDLDPRVGDIAADIAKHGVEKVEAALKAAKESDNRGRASLRFYLEEDLKALIDEMRDIALRGLPEEVREDGQN